MTCPTALPVDPRLTAARSGDEDAWLALYDTCVAGLFDRLAPLGAEQALARLVDLFDEVLARTSAATVTELQADLDVAAGGVLATAA